MKQCPECGKSYVDASLNYCLEDGSPLLYAPASAPTDEPATAILSSAETASEKPTRTYDPRLHGRVPSRSGEAIEPADRRFVPTRNSIVAGMIGILLVGALVAGSYFYYGRYSKQIESIAVMPFSTGEADTEYLSQGLAESLIYRLNQVQSLRVSPTSSVFRYKGTAYDPIQAGRELNVDAIVVGRISQRGDDLIISAELVDVRNSKSLWGEQYDRKITDALATQREIAREIAETLKIQVSSEPGLTKNYTNNNEAYLFYWKGRLLADRRAKVDLENAIQAYRKAIDLDPGFALAYVGIADAYNAMPPYGYMAPKDAFVEARAAVKRALEIDPSLAEAHSAYGVILANYDWNWTEAEREHKTAIELAPNRELPYYNYATGFLLAVGRTDEAISALKRAVEIEPKSPNSNARLATAYGFARQYDLALEQARRTFELDPGFIGARTGLMGALVFNGLFDETIKLGEETLVSAPDHQQVLTQLGLAYAKAGRLNEARKVLAEINEHSKTGHVLSARVARIHIALGERDKAFEWLEKAYRDRDWFLPSIKVDSAYDEIRGDPRYTDLLRRMGLE